MADRVLDGKLDETVATLRHDGMSWAAISKHLLTEHGVDVTDQTLIRWYPDLAEAQS
jgi:intein-encoded DNA endonuclease-like protein